MEWYGWLIVALVLALIAGILAFRLIRASRRGRRFLALTNAGKLTFARTLLVDGEVSVFAKLSLALLVGYFALPIHLIPDRIPVLGKLDDGFVVVVAVGLLLIAVPRGRFELALTSAEAADAGRARAVPASAAGSRS